VSGSVWISVESLINLVKYSQRFSASSSSSSTYFGSHFLINYNYNCTTPTTAACTGIDEAINSSACNAQIAVVKGGESGAVAVGGCRGKGNDGLDT
jgi:hypothetical protein